MTTPHVDPVPPAMRAIVQEGYGTPDVLRLAERTPPHRDADEVLVRVAAAGVDSGTWHIMHGRPLLVRLAFGLRRPRREVPGLDLAGTVVAVGSKVTRFAVGDEVVGIGRGSLAEYTVALEHKLAHRPDSVEITGAAALPVSGLTALQALRDSAGVGPGDRVLVIGASGGVGSYAVQIATALGAEVVGVCSAAKFDAVRSWGATEVVDRGVPRWWQPLLDRGERFDAVIDIAGRLPVSDLRRLTAPDGALVFVGGEGGGALTGGMGRQIRGVVIGKLRRRRITLFVSRERGDDVGRLVELVEAGTLVPPVDRRFALADAADALWAIERGEVRGKLVVTI